MKKLRFFSILLVITVIFTGCTTNNQRKSEKLEDEITDNLDIIEEKEEIKSIETIKVPYDENDELNPYTLKTQLNKHIVPLMFDGLVKIDANYKAENCIAREITKQGNIVTVKLKNNVYFSDNSKVTADEVISSFDLAKNSQTNYAYNLQKVNSVKKTSVDTLTFEMSEDSKNYKNLFDFPIVKTVSDEKVVGSGRYELAQNTKESYLLKSLSNLQYQASNYPVKKIELINSDGKSSPTFEINMGEIDLAFNRIELKNDKAVTLPYTIVPTNNLIYIGINGTNDYLKNNEFRKAFFNSLDVTKLGVYVSLRDDLSLGSYLNPMFYNSATPKQNLIEAKKILDSLGYKSEKPRQIRTNSDNEKTSLKLLVNEENAERNMIAQEIKRQMFEVGIEIEIIKLPFDEYKKSFKSKDYDLYIAEIGLADDLDLMPILKQNMSFSNTEKSASITEYEKYQKGEIDEKELCEKLSSDVAFIPIAYSDALLYHKRNFVSYIVATNEDIFYNILNWEIE